MKPLPLLLLALVLVSTTLRADSPPSTTTPDDSHSKKYAAWYATSQKYVNGEKGKPCDILFIGDSITWGWLGQGKNVWQKYYAPRHALDFGLPADTTGNVLWRLDNWDVKDLHPKVQVVLIGTNNTPNTPQEIADGVHAILDKTQAMYPGLKTILVSIMPNKRANQKMMDADVLIRKLSDNKDIYYLDLVPLMPPVVAIDATGKSDTNWKGLGKDHLHPVQEGYQIWADAMEPLLTALLGGTDPGEAATTAANPSPVPVPAPVQEAPMPSPSPAAQ